MTIAAKQSDLQQYVRSAPLIGKASIVTLATFKAQTNAGRRAIWQKLAPYQKLSIANEIDRGNARNVMAELEARFGA